MDRGRFKKKKDDKAWLDWLSDDAPAKDISAPDDSFPIDPKRLPNPPVAESRVPEVEAEEVPVAKQPEILKPIPVIPEAPPERRPIFGADGDVPKFARRPRGEPEPPKKRIVPVVPTIIEPAALPAIPVAKPLQPIPQKAEPAKPKRSIQQHVLKPDTETRAKAESSAPVAVSIQINMPAFHKPQFKRSKATWQAIWPHITWARILKVTIPLVIIAVLWGGLAFAKQRADQRHVAQVAAAESDTPKTIAATKPPFTPVVPSTNAKLGMPDNVHSRYDGTKKSYSYIDDIGGKQFTVSQQQLPTDGTPAIDTVAKVAKSLNATIKLKTGYGTAYLLTNQKYNSQSLVFSIRGQLMFINSSFVFTQDQWVEYINALS